MRSGKDGGKSTMKICVGKSTFGTSTIGISLFLGERDLLG